MLILLFFAFFSGLVTILAPCIWPLLPIVLSTSLGGGKAKSFGITLGILATFGLLTVGISYLVKLFGFDPNILRIVAVSILILLGLSMVIPFFARILEGLVSRFAGRFGQKGNIRSGFAGGFVTGASLGIVWTPCAGPILAAIATLSLTSKVNFGIILVTIAYLIGVGIPLFFFSYGGQKLVSETRFLSRYTGRVQQIFGVVLLVTATLIATNYDKVIQAKILDTVPSYSQFLTSFERSKAVKEQLDKLKGPVSGNGSKQNDSKILDKDLFNENTPAGDFVGITKWLNTDKPLTLRDLRGKVVLVDFWTYTCINCIRTLPHVTSWYDKYRDMGFVVVGVHTPEFEFEKDTKNVENAIKQYNIHYPVAQDNNFATWNNYNNQYWPAEYLIDAKGNIRRTHFGEGKYDETERAIQELLKEAGQQVNSSLESMPDQTPKARQSPETYLGSSRMQYYYPNGNIENGQQVLTLSESLPDNSFSLGGEWNITNEQAVSGKSATLAYHFSANKVNLVLRPGSGKQGKIKVFVDGKVVDNNNAGVDVKNGLVTVDSDRLYVLVDLHGKVENHILKLEFQAPGIEAFAFTFG